MAGSGAYLRTKWRRPSLRTRRRESLRTRSWPRRQAAHKAAGADAFLPTIGVRNLWSCFQLSVTLYALRRRRKDVRGHPYRTSALRGGRGLAQKIVGDR